MAPLLAVLPPELPLSSFLVPHAASATARPSTAKPTTRCRAWRSSGENTGLPLPPHSRRQSRYVVAPDRGGASLSAPSLSRTFHNFSRETSELRKSFDIFPRKTEDRGRGRLWRFTPVARGEPAQRDRGSAHRGTDDAQRARAGDQALAHHGRDAAHRVAGTGRGQRDAGRRDQRAQGRG